MAQYIKNKKSWSVRFYFNNERVFLRGFKKKADAKEAEAEYRKNNTEIKKDITVGKYFDMWFENYVDDLGENTKENYACIINKHVLPKFENMLLTDLKSDVLQEFYTEKKKILSGTRVNGIHKLIKMALSYAVMWEYLRSNPAQYVKAPVIDKPKIVIPTDVEMKKILEYARSYDAYIAIIIGATTGMRMSEILALEMDSIDMENRKFIVKNSYNDTKNIIDKTKTEASERYVTMLKGTEIEFQKYIYQKKKNMVQFGSMYYNNNFLCTYVDGLKLTRNYVSKRFKKIVRKLNLDDNINFKSLRHYHASWLLRQKVHPKVVQERLGHKSIKITLDTYTHLIDSLQDKIINSLDW